MSIQGRGIYWDALDPRMAANVLFAAAHIGFHSRKKRTAADVS